MPPLSIALMNGTWDIAKRLIEAGSDVIQWDISGQGPLNVAIVNLTVRGNGNPLIRMPDQTTARDVVKMLVELGANPNQQLYYHAAARTILGADIGRGTTPFLSACAYGDIGIVKLLLAHGANPRLANPGWPGSHHPRDHGAHHRHRLSGTHASQAWRRRGASWSWTRRKDQKMAMVLASVRRLNSSGCWPPVVRT